LAWLDARAQGGRFIVRMEDLDRPRVIQGVGEQQLHDLRWLGLDWDEGPDVGGPHGSYVQSQRLEQYQVALTRLLEMGRAYPCICSRRDVQRMASAPHPGEDGPPYPLTCRGRFPNAHSAEASAGRPPAWRFKVEAGLTRVPDRWLGTMAQDVMALVGDVLICRADGVFAYQLAVVVDDAAMGVTHVVRAADLASSTPRQVQLFRALGWPVPAFAHVPLLHNAQGHRLEKRAPMHTVAGLRSQGVAPGRVVAWLAESARLPVEREECSPHDLIHGFEMAAVRDAPNWAGLPSHGL
jgi:glutamyl-tRNA synthetase